MEDNMSKITLEFKFQIGQTVYHILPDSPQGIVTDILYNHSTRLTQYEVTFDPESNPSLCMGWELQTHKTFKEL